MARHSLRKKPPPARAVVRVAMAGFYRSFRAAQTPAVRQSRQVLQHAYRMLDAAPEVEISLLLDIRFLFA
jgi:hypothetical protein